MAFSTAGTYYAFGWVTGSVAANSASVLVRPNEPERKALSLYNDSPQVAFVNFGPYANSVAFVIRMGADSYYELQKPCVTGSICAAWGVATGSMKFCETL
jgi:hypothetical protein